MVDGWLMVDGCWLLVDGSDIRRFLQNPDVKELFHLLNG
jgi:hypothetical protein